MGAEKPNTEKTFEVEEALRIIEHASALDQRTAIRQAAIEALQIAEPKSEKPASLDKNHLFELAETLSITRASLEKAISLYAMTTEDKKADAKKYNVQKTPDAIYAERYQYMQRFGAEILQILRDNCPQDKWSYSVFFSPKQPGFTGKEHSLIIIKIRQTEYTKKQKGKFKAWLTGDTPTVEKKESPFATIQIGVYDNDERAAFLENPIATKLLGEVLTEEEFDITIKYPILD